MGLELTADRYPPIMRALWNINVHAINTSVNKSLYYTKTEESISITSINFKT